MFCRGCLDCTDDAEFPQGSLSCGALRFQLSPLPLQGTWEESKQQIQRLEHIPLKIEIVLKELRYIKLHKYVVLSNGQFDRF